MYIYPLCDETIEYALKAWTFYAVLGLKAHVIVVRGREVQVENQPVSFSSMQRHKLTSKTLSHLLDSMS